MIHLPILKLQQVQLIPHIIWLPVIQINKLLEYSVYTLEIWKDEIYLDQTDKIIISRELYDPDFLKLTFKNAIFSFKTAEIFYNKRSANLQLKLMRSNNFTAEFQLLETFSIYLSFYAYEYAKVPISRYRKQIRGRKMLNQSILDHSTAFFYENPKRQNFLATTAQRESIQERKRQQQNQKTSNMFEQLLLIPKLDRGSSLHENSDVFIDYEINKLFTSDHSKPHQKDNLINIQRSMLYPKGLDSNINSGISQNRQFEISLNKLKLYLFNIFIILELIIGVNLMFPIKKL